MNARSLAQIKRFKDPEERKKCGLAFLGKLRPDHSRHMKMLWNKRSFRQKMAKSLTPRGRRAIAKAALAIGPVNLRKCWTSEEFREKVSEAVASRNHRLWKDKDYRERMLKVLKKCKKSRLRGYRQALSQTKIAMSKAGSETMARLRKDPEWLELVMRSHVRVSKPQMSLFKSLCARGVKGLKLEYQVGPYSADIALVGAKIDIECDGQYWHHERLSIRQHNLFKRRRNAYFKRRGWKVFRVKAWPSLKKRRIVALRTYERLVFEV